jgi:GT2 family glycosyltransferase
MKASIIITNYNGKELLEKNLPAVISAKNNPKNNIQEIIVVDDFSTDDSLIYLNSLKSEINLIKHTKNRGFSATTNTGARSAKGDLLVLLNNDVSPSHDFLISIQKLFNDDKKLFGISMHERGYGPAVGNFKDGYIELSMGKEDNKSKRSFYVSGGSGVFKKEVWKELGGLDENLLSPYYWEDLDLCYRAYKQGYYCLWDPDSKVNHKHESTISKLNQKKVDIIRERNQLLMIWKNIHSPNMFKKHLRGVIKRVFEHPGYIKIVFFALLKLSVLIKERKKQKKASIVSDEAVFLKI